MGCSRQNLMDLHFCEEIKNRKKRKNFCALCRVLMSPNTGIHCQTMLYAMPLGRTILVEILYHISPDRKYYSVLWTWISCSKEWRTNSNYARTLLLSSTSNKSLNKISSHDGAIYRFIKRRLVRQYEALNILQARTMID